MKAYALATSLCILAGACTTVESRHGYRPPDPREGIVVEVGQSTQDSVLREYGTPSIRPVFDDTTWYYISSRRGERAVLEPQTLERQIVALTFDENGVLQSRQDLNLEDGMEVAVVGRETPTRGRELSFFEQLFGTLGRLPVPDQQQQVPGQGPGRRP
jgi:outer membrane protein assembly factor BamE (lipoprotein component of BamABCDE complex)